MTGKRLENRKRSAREPNTRGIVLIHGIRTRAPWQLMVKQMLEKNPSVSVIPIGYGKLDTLSFLLPGPTRKIPIRTTTKKLRAAIMTFGSKENPVSVIAHSFGTYSLAKILEENRDIELQDVVLCGAIIPDDYDWGATRRQIRGRIVSEYGTRDVWPAVAKSVTWGYGAAGTY